MSTEPSSAPRGLLTRYLSIEAASGVVLALCTVAALVLANSPWSPHYDALLAWHPVLELGSLRVELPFHIVVNDGLMTIFFFAVGLEIRRELHAGELADVRRASLPAAAAIGGMVIPALLYFAFNPSGPTQRGWGIPMATDIAFAVAALGLVGKRVVPALRVLLLALAIIDDIGGVLVIAIFYSKGISLQMLGLAALATMITLGMRAFRIRSPWAYALPALVVWFGFHEGGVHATMAGVLMGILTPPQRGFGTPAQGSLDAPTSPSERLQHLLHPWVAFLVMPLFAFANAGVTLSWPAAEPAVAIGILLGLVLGKPLGVLGASWLAVRFGLAQLPTGVGWRGVLVVGIVAGVGFTVALFIGNLGLPEPGALASAKLGILIGSAAALVLAVAAGRILLPQAVLGAARTAEEAERSTER
ncbi:MAG: Na+/H+ antiporter NhaA [Deltaproteobacteria bacterium]|nr:Na+/H+ antiporter NhaA [Nannocystaceae bacterium]